MKKILLMLCGFISISNHAYAFCFEENCKPWIVAGAFGISSFPELNPHEFNSVGRLSVGRVLHTQTYWQLGIEAGVQNGSTHRLEFPKEDIDALGGVPIDIELSPMLDFLVSFRTETFQEIPVFTWLKAGVMYRQMKVDRPSVNNLNDFSPEIQAGFGYRINEYATVNLGYQYIWGNKPSLTINPVEETGVLQHIPSQQALMLGFSFNFG